MAESLFDAQLRSGDAIGRMRGDEFAVVLAGVDDAQAVEIAERLRANYVTAAAMISPELHPSMSMGIAMISGEYIRKLARCLH
ncbi:MAG: diguanylate cyclase [Phycisphaerae bacterium]